MVQFDRLNNVDPDLYIFKPIKIEDQVVCMCRTHVKCFKIGLFVSRCKNCHFDSTCVCGCDHYICIVMNRYQDHT